MAALASICVSAHTHTHSLLREAMYSLKVPNQQRWWWFVSLPSLFGVISVNCFAGDKQLAVKTHMLYIRHITAGCGAAPCGSYLPFLFFLFFGAGPAFVLALLFARYFLFVNHLCWPAPCKKDRRHLYRVFSPSLFFSLFFWPPLCWCSRRCIFLYWRFRTPAPRCLYMCGRASFVFLCSCRLSSELKAIENGLKCRVCWGCVGDGRLWCSDF